MARLVKVAHVLRTMIYIDQKSQSPRSPRITPNPLPINQPIKLRQIPRPNPQLPPRHLNRLAEDIRPPIRPAHITRLPNTKPNAKKRIKRVRVNQLPAPERIELLAQPRRPVRELAQICFLGDIRYSCTSSQCLCSYSNGKNQIWKGEIYAASTRRHQRAQSHRPAPSSPPYSLRRGASLAWSGPSHRPSQWKTRSARSGRHIPRLEISALSRRGGSFRRSGISCLLLQRGCDARARENRRQW